MSTKLFPAIILAVALGQTACSDEINTANPIEPTPNPITETFTGTTPGKMKTADAVRGYRQTANWGLKTPLPSRCGRQAHHHCHTY